MKEVSAPELKNSYQDSEINNISMATSLSILNQVDGNKKENKLSISCNDKEMDIGELINEKEKPKEEQKELLSIVFLQEELQRSLDREHYFILLIETMYTKVNYNPISHNENIRLNLT